MVANAHNLISDLSEQYAAKMLEVSGDSFTKANIAAAYIIGAEETLQRVCNVIRHSAKCNGLTQTQCATLLSAIQLIESNNL